MRSPWIVLPSLALAGWLGCAAPIESPSARCEPTTDRDPHSLGNPQEIEIAHIELDLTVDFSRKVLTGSATLHIDNRTGATALRLDSSGLAVRSATLDDGASTPFRFAEPVEYLGRALIVDVRPQTKRVRIEYESSPDSMAVQWLEPEQTAGGKHPFLLTQSESVFARAWIPCHDSPAVRLTYDATIRVPPGLLALMSAENPTVAALDGVHRFTMKQSIPPYLLAMVVGDLEYRELGSRTGVYAEPSVIDAAQAEFVETERMLEAAEQLVGPYRWGRYDMVVLPPSFPYGGMENPRLTFVTPTLIAGDRSLVSTVAHEIAHSWSGNLVTHAGWGELWLNEGLTSYIEKRIMERLHGRDLSEMLTVIDTQSLHEELRELEPLSPLSHLRQDLSRLSPEDSFSSIIYEKGSLFMRMVEEAVGREAWDAFLRRYFEELAFSRIDTDEFLCRMRAELIEPRADAAELERSMMIEGWIDGPALPANAARVTSHALAAVTEQLERLEQGQPVGELATADWSSSQWIYFVRNLPAGMGVETMQALDDAHRFSDSGNAEILQAWLIQSVRLGYAGADAALERFLMRVGRIKYIGPLYKEMASHPEGLLRARRLYARARPGYHGVARESIERELAEKGAPAG